MNSKTTASTYYVMVDFGSEYALFKSSELKELERWPMKAAQKGGLVTYKGVKGCVEFVAESKDAMMDAVLKRHPYLIELVIDVTDAAWDRSNEEYESKFRKDLVQLLDLIQVIKCEHNYCRII